MSNAITNTLTPRVRKLREILMTIKPEICVERARLVTEAYKETEADPPVIRRAKALRKILTEMTIDIYDGELIVGNRASKRRSATLFPEYSIDWIEEELDNFPTREVDQFQISEESKRVLREKVFPYWRGKTVKDLALNMLPAESKRVMHDHVFTCALYMNDGLGHVILDYEKVLKKGLLGIAEEAKDVLKTLDISEDPGALEKIHFLNAVLTVCEAACQFAARFAAKARTMASSEDDLQRKQELERIASNCERVPAKPARTFWEAIQSFWFIQLITQIDSNGLSISPGRFDQYVYPFYEADLKAGLITREEAQELIDLLWIKFTEIIHLYNYESARNNAGFPISQNLVLGGQNEAGEDVTNDISFMCLEAGKRIRLIQPNYGVRLHKNMRQDFLMKICEVIRVGTGMPQTFNDEIIIPSLLNRGIPLSDARNYGVVGCVEPSIPGKTWGMTNAGYLNLAKCMELALNNGRCRLTGRQIGPQTGEPTQFESFEDVMSAYRTQVAFFVKHMIIVANAIEAAHRELAPVPWVSAMIGDCISRGMDVTQGGAIYNFSGPQGVGVANVADSLAAIKVLVFEEKKITMQDLLCALDCNYEGHEDIRQILKKGAPKYGNDNDEVDLIAREVAAIYCREVEQYSTLRGGQYQPGVYPTTAHIALGKEVGATPDGRKARESLADGVSPSHGSDIRGPSAVMKSVAKLDHLLASNGTQFNQKLSPSLIADDMGLLRFSQLLRTWIGLKGMHVQFNVISADTLRAAQKKPEEYRHLVVRVAGYSAFFTELSEEIQNDIIGRTEQVTF